MMIYDNLKYDYGHNKLLCTRPDPFGVSMVVNKLYCVFSYSRNKLCTLVRRGPVLFCYMYFIPHWQIVDISTILSTVCLLLCLFSVYKYIVYILRAV